MKTNDTLHKQVTAYAQDIGERTVRFCISSEEEDRDGDILRAEGCDFTNFARNPQFLGFHDSRDFPLGIPRKWWIDPRAKKVYADVYFPTVDELATDPETASEKAKLVDFTYNCYKTGMLSAVSVGFIINEFEDKAEGNRFGHLITKWELLEFSAVAVPANASALAEAVKSFDPEGKYAEYFTIAPEPEPVTKSGRRISAATMKELEALKACHGKIKDAMATLKACHSEMDGILADLMIEPEPDDDVLPGDDDGEVIDIAE